VPTNCHDFSSHIIKGVFFGHSHLDFFRLSIVNDTGRSRRYRAVQPPSLLWPAAHHLIFLFATVTLVTSSGVASGVSFVPTSLTPDGQRNPSFRVYEADANTGEILDYIQYRLDLAAQGGCAEMMSEGS
jgi:hypothetical protein